MRVAQEATNGRGSQGRRTQEAIYACAIRSFATKGYAGTSMRALAAEVGIEVGSLYRHFASKEELLFNIVRAAGEDFYQSLTAALEAAGDEPVERLRAIIEENARYHAVHQAQSFVGGVEIRELTKLHHKHVIKQRHDVEDLVKSLVEECLAAGYFPPESNISITTNFLLAVGTSVATWFDPSGPLRAEEVARMAAEFALPPRPVQAGRRSRASRT